MSRYKDVDKILEAMDTWPKYGCNPDGRFLELTKETEADYVPYVHYDDMVKVVKGIPSLDVAPVIHAHKVRAHSQGGGTHWVVCSHCEKPIDWQDAYCKHCGAIMDEEVE